LCSRITNNNINIGNVNYRKEDYLALSQLPVVDLGEDFDFIEKIENCNISKNEKEAKSIKEKKEITLEAWSKGHVAGLKVKF
jgi:hypothetical protein